jgi:tRNA pseudouridine38-40 synthase
MSHRYWALQMAYDGRQFQGFQALPGKRTVQAELEKALKQLLRKPVQVVCAGRTDAGVHAHGQLVSFGAQLPFPAAEFRRLLPHFLPEDLALKAVWPIPEDFHARFSARARHYRYLLRLNAAPDPFQAPRCWQYPHPVDPDALAKAWAQCQGQYDFGPLARSQSNQIDRHLSVYLSELRPLGEWYALEIVANRFLTSLVRRLVGTALDMARGRLPADYLSHVLRGKITPSEPLGTLAPAQGLYLCRVLYPPEYGLELIYPDPLPAASEAQIPAQALCNPGKWWQD